MSYGEHFLFFFSIYRSSNKKLKNLILIIKGKNNTALVSTITIGHLSTIKHTCLFLTDMNTIVCLAVQVLFACAEALHAHGYSNEACRLAVELARDLLANPPDLKLEQSQTKVHKVTVAWHTFFCAFSSARSQTSKFANL